MFFLIGCFFLTIVNLSVAKQHTHCVCLRDYIPKASPAAVADFCSSSSSASGPSIWAARPRPIPAMHNGAYAATSSKQTAAPATGSYSPMQPLNLGAGRGAAGLGRGLLIAPAATTTTAFGTIGRGVGLGRGLPLAPTTSTLGDIGRILSYNSLCVRVPSVDVGGEVGGRGRGVGGLSVCNLPSGPYGGGGGDELMNSITSRLKLMRTSDVNNEDSGSRSWAEDAEEQEEDGGSPSPPPPVHP